MHRRQHHTNWGTPITSRMEASVTQECTGLFPLLRTIGKEFVSLGFRPDPNRGANYSCKEPSNIDSSVQIYKGKSYPRSSGRHFRNAMWLILVTGCTCGLRAIPGIPSPGLFYSHPLLKTPGGKKRGHVCIYMPPCSIIWRALEKHI